ncbi:divisome protein SepX/GlpR, partial [Modestobacter versicolor]
MGSGVLLAALVVLWFVVLVPMVVTRGDAHATAGAADSGRTLQRRRPVDPVVHAETERVTIDRAALVSSGELRVDVHAVRRRTLAGLVALAVLALVGALTYRSWLWAPQLLLDVAVVGYLMVIKAAADRERRAAARRNARLAHRARVEQERPA